MRLTIHGIDDGGRIPPRFALGVQDPEDHVRLGENQNPGISWEDVPENARSLVLLCVDTDVPSKPDDVNQDGRIVPADLPRTEFYHWVMVDIPTGCTGVSEGECSRGVTAGGKQDPLGPAGSRQGTNDYTAWFAGDAGMSGTYLGYDGPCPPWNDSIPHHYHFVIYATDLDRCPVEGSFGGQEVRSAIEGHVLAEARLTGVYWLNPDLD